MVAENQDRDGCYEEVSGKEKGQETNINRMLKKITCKEHPNRDKTRKRRTRERQREEKRKIKR